MLDDFVCVIGLNMTIRLLGGGRTSWYFFYYVRKKRNFESTGYYFQLSLECKIIQTGYQLCMCDAMTVDGDGFL